jgi:SAM-dependent methyltransferase
VSGGPQELADAAWEALPEDAVPERLALRRAFLLAHVRPGERVLDVGAGAGELAAALRAAGCEVVAVDLAPEALRRAAARVPGLDARHWPAGAPLPVKDASVDVAWAGEVLEHVVDLAPWLSELRRALRPGGRLLVSTPHVGRGRLLLLAASPRRFAEHFEPRSDHVRFFSPRTLRALLEDLGFEVRELRLAGGLPGLRTTILACAVRG